ncbi:MAG: TldD/PmbA family protein [Candidatus Binatia bacterium]
MQPEALLDICSDIVARARRAGAEEAEAVAGWHRGVDTRIENDDIHTVQTTDETMFGVRVYVAGSLGFTTANALDPGTLDACVEEAVAQARVTPADPVGGLPAAADVNAVAGLYHDGIAAIDVADTTELASALIDRAKARDARVRIDSGGVSAGEGAVALVSTTGNAHSERSTSAGGSLFGMAVDGEDVASFDYDGDATRAPDRLRALLESSVDRFVDKCLSGLGAGPGRSFKGSIVLSPEAVGEFLLPNLIAALSADAVRKGRSPLADKLGESIAHAAFSLIDDGTIAGGIGSTAFDREGVSVRRTPLVEDGVLQTFLYNHYEARAAGNGLASTGHAAGSASSLPGIGTNYLDVAAGTATEADLVSGSEPVVWVGRFSGSSNPVTGDFSGVVKNGFLIEGGAGGNRKPIRETMIAGNLFDTLKRIEAVSADRRLLGGTALLPSIRLGGISVTSG